MSKSYGNTIGLTEAPASVAKKILEMSTNGQRIRQTDPGNPDLCPVGDLHNIFSDQSVIDSTRSGCKTASIRCEICKMDAAKSVCAVTGPIYNRRIQLESKIEDTWDTLREQSRRAAARAERTMLPVRNILDLSHDLGAVRRHFMASTEERLQNHDLSMHSEWWTLAPAQRAKLLRDYWRNNLVPYDIQLSQESNRVFASLERELEEPLLTTKKKRLFVTTARNHVADRPNEWLPRVPVKTFEVWALLCWERETYWLRDFIIPQRFYSQQFALAKRSLKKDDSVHLTVRRDGQKFWLTVAESEPVDITELQSNYDPLV